MHQSPSQMVMESTTLSMIHRSDCPNEKKEQAKVEPRSCQRTKQTKDKPQERRSNKPKRKEDNTQATTQQQADSQQEALV